MAITKQGCLDPGKSPEPSLWEGQENQCAGVQMAVSATKHCPVLLQQTRHKGRNPRLTAQGRYLEDAFTIPVCQVIKARSWHSAIGYHRAHVDRTTPCSRHCKPLQHKGVAGGIEKMILWPQFRKMNPNLHSPGEEHNPPSVAHLRD